MKERRRVEKKKRRDVSKKKKGKRRKRSSKWIDSAAAVLGWQNDKAMSSRDTVVSSPGIQRARYRQRQ